MTTDLRRRDFLAGALALAAGCGDSVSQLRDVPELPAAEVLADPHSNFHAIYDDPALRDRFYGFVEHVFTLFPAEKIHELAHRLTRTHAGDEAIYRAMIAGLPGIQPFGSALTHALPALQKQKSEMSRQASVLLGDRPRIDGYLEMGTTGRYRNALNARVPIEGPQFVLNSTAPSKDPVDLVERGQLDHVGTFVPMGDYDPIAGVVPDASLDVVNNMIGLHHCPEAPLDAFVGSLRRVLRPGGMLLIREHDARDETMQRLVALAHDVFNAGTFVPWEGNAAEVRRFRSVEGWTSYLETQGFERVGPGGSAGGLRQAGDPTDNELLAFRKA